MERNQTADRNLGRALILAIFLSLCLGLTFLPTDPSGNLYGGKTGPLARNAPFVGLPPISPVPREKP